MMKYLADTHILLWAKLTQEQFLDLMEGFAIERKVTIRKVNPEV